VQSIVTRAKGEWEAKEGQVGQVRKAIQDPNVMSLLEMGADMFTEEVFMFADGRLSELVIQINELADEVHWKNDSMEVWMEIWRESGFDATLTGDYEAETIKRMVFYRRF
jgi:hypothetical protein